jgi:4-oxalocrotonate tautomerase
MPVVIVEMWEGRTKEQKRGLIKAITEAMVENCGTGAEHLHVIIHDVPKESWGRNGTIATELPQEAKKPSPAIRRMSHMLLFVEDLDRALAFYTGLLGLQVREETTLPDGRTSVSTVQGLGITTYPRGETKGKRFEHMAFRCAGGIGPVVECLKAAFIPFEGPRRSPYGMSVYFEDPDGNRVECHDSTGV